MRFRIQTDIFRRAIEATGHATSTNNLTPILENILIDAQFKRLVLTGNNLAMAIEYIVEKGVAVEAEGRFTLSSKFLMSYIALVQDSEVTVELEKGGSLMFRTKSGETKFKGISGDKFPSIPPIPTLTPIMSTTTITDICARMRTGILLPSSATRRLHRIRRQRCICRSCACRSVSG